MYTPIVGYFRRWSRKLNMKVTEPHQVSPLRGTSITDEADVDGQNSVITVEDIEDQNEDVEFQHEESKPTDPISSALHPLFLFMNIFALFPSYKKEYRTKCAFIGIFIYSLLVLLNDWFNAIRLFFSYEGEVYGPDLLLKILMNVGFLQVAITTTIVFINSWKIPAMLTFWEEIHSCYDSGKMSKQKVRRILQITLIFLIIVNIIPWIFLVFPGQLQKDLIHIFSLPFKTDLNQSWRYILLIMTTILTQIWFFNRLLAFASFLVITTILIAADFQKLNSDMIEDVNPLPSNELFTRFDPEKYRQRHLKICKLVSMFDDIISSSVLLIYVANIPIICFNLYILTYTDSYIDVANFWVSCVICFGFLMLITAAGTYLDFQVSRKTS